jgi:hypothetical protein
LANDPAHRQRWKFVPRPTNSGAAVEEQRDRGARNHKHAEAEPKGEWFEAVGFVIEEVVGEVYNADKRKEDSASE